MRRRAPCATEVSTSTPLAHKVPRAVANASDSLSGPSPPVVMTSGAGSLGGKCWRTSVLSMLRGPTSSSSAAGCDASAARSAGENRTGSRRWRDQYAGSRACDSLNSAAAAVDITGMRGAASAVLRTSASNTATTGSIIEE